MMKSQFISLLLKIPLLNSFLRKCANKFEEGSIVTIKSGFAQGMLWKRYHRYVNGYWAGIFELPIQQRIALELKEGDTFFDIGANAGFFSLVAAKTVGYSGRVVAFEPLPMNACVIKEQFELNKLTNCQCIQCAVGNFIGKAKFILPRTKDGKPSTSTAHLSNNTIIDGNENYTMDCYDVEIVTLDYYCKNNLFPNLIKIDVEGAEGKVLRGAQELIKSDRAPIIIMETHGIEVANDVNSQLKEAKYNFFTISGEPLKDGLTERHYLAYPPNINKKPIKF